MARYEFASDNTAGACPEALDALATANAGFASVYGTDHVTRRAADLVREVVDADAEVRFVSNGTAANAIALAALARPFEAVLAHEHAHVRTDETGAPGFFGQGVGLVGLPGPSGRIDPAALSSALDQPDLSHRQSPAALSLTNATEFGAVYTKQALRALIEPVKARGYGVHLDGARIANAAASGFDLKALKRLGVDIAVLGGTKSGMPLSDAIVVFDPALARRFDARLKQGGQLPAKGRMVSAPWIGMLESGVWINRAAHANAMARRLAGLTPFPLAHPVEANGVFLHMDETRLTALRKAGWMAYRFLDGSVRFMCSWATTPEAVDELGEALKAIA